MRYRPLIIVGSMLLSLSLVVRLEAAPHFRVYPRYIENDIRGMGQTRDTLRISNAEGDEDLTWRMEIRILGEPADSGWITATALQGRVAPGQWVTSIVLMNGRNLENGHYFADFFFTSNDPNRPEWTVPVAGHKDDFPRIAAEWQVPQQGDWTVIDMNRFLGELYWGNTYNFNITIRNRGAAQLVVDSLVSQNAYFRLNPARFNLAAGTNRQVQVIFTAEEIRANSTTVTSITNVWDPAEISFRIIATVSPVFRFGSPVADFSMDEDAAERLVADLDTVFISSYAETNYNVSGGLGFTYRLARNRELFVRPRTNWNGVSTFFLSASLGDTVVLADTFIVTVNPVPDPPGAFDLIAPVDDDTLWPDRGDSLFVWQSSTDPDGDAVKYSLFIISPHGDTICWQNLTDTTLSSWAVFLDDRFTGTIEWTVAASDTLLKRQAWSTFRLHLLPGRQPAPLSDRWPNVHGISVFPNPTNGLVCLNVALKSAGFIRLEILSAEGRLIDHTSEGFFPAGRHQFSYNLGSAPSGVYLVKITTMSYNGVFPIQLTK
ncbi:MAG: T9SS type A sorting domain-containing protein [Calditrichaeota bacterium]|nr:T9SS type A sorting domain-containing protein [Calditrichota bacterium]